jgi:hypothetical protein
VCNDGRSFRFATEAYGLKFKRCEAATVLTELKDAAKGNKMKMTTHLYEWCSIQTGDITSVGMVFSTTDDITLGVQVNRLMAVLLLEWHSTVMTARLWEWCSID